MDDGERARIERHCARLVAASAVCLNRHDYEGLALLFTEDCVWEHPNAASAWRGRGDLRTRILPQLRRHGRHNVIRYVPALPLIEVRDGDTADGLTYYTVYAHNADDAIELPAPLAGPSGMAEWHDTYRRGEAGWLIHRRRSVHVFRRR